MFDTHTLNIYNNHVARVEPYRGGHISDIKRIRCYTWYGSCNQIIEKSPDNARISLTWYRIEKAIDLDGLPSNSWSWYHDFLYVRYSKPGAPNDPGHAIVDLVLGDPHSREPPAYVVKDARTSVGRPKSRLDITYNYNNWDLKPDGIWVKYDRPNAKDAITDVMYLFGPDIIEPRADWTLVPGARRFQSTLPIRVVVNRDVSDIGTMPVLKFNRENEFKVLQISDLHFSSNFGICKDQVEKQVECKADSKTLNFIHQVLDYEKPQLVVITGDILDGQNTFDYQTALLKALSPMITRSIPFAVALGENDFNKFVSRDEIVEFIASLPESVMVRDTEDRYIQNVTNYALPVFEGDIVTGAIYILDIFNESSEPVSTILQRSFKSLKQKPKLSIEFQHLPIQEYRPKGAFAIVGSYNEKHKLKKSKTDGNTRRALSDIGVQVMSVGSEHTNDCCIKGRAEGDSLRELWMCFGGSVGEGAYGDSKQDRRVRLFRMNSQNNDITTWKRRQSDSATVFDYQYIYKG
jgi:predicted MPP superfamily phosphohydrolase